MRAQLRIGPFLVLASVFGVGGAALAESPCPSNMTSHKDLPLGKSIECSCSSDQMKGTVWGTGSYTTDSSVCHAAKHAGVVGASGGTVTVFRGEGCQKFTGTDTNGVRSSNWGPYGSTFSFHWPSDCTQRAHMPGEPCPQTMNAYRAKGPGQELACSCKPTQFGGSIWGTDRYTTDSSTCGAALHAGAVPAAGGAVHIRTAEGCSKFVGSARAGISTNNWGSYDRTFHFEKSPPACVK